MPVYAGSRPFQWSWLLSVLLIFTLTSCVQGTPTPEPVTISFSYPDVDTDHYQQLLQVFNESYPHITVDLRPKRWDALEGIDLDDADVYVTSQFALNWLQEQGRTLNLTPFIEQDESFDLSDYYPGTIGLYNREGKTWGIPAGIDLMVMYYNRDLLEQYNVALPQPGWTWDDFLEITAGVRDPGANVFGYGVSQDNLFDPLTFIYQHGGKIFDDLQNPRRTTFDDPLTIEALEWYTRLMFDYNIAPTPEQIRDAFGGGSLQAGILRDQVGLWSGMLSERGGQNWPVEWDMRWGMAPLPRDAQAATLTLVEGYFISPEAEHPEACWQWLSFLSTQLPSRQVPARKSLAESAAYEQLVGEEVAKIAQASMESALLLSPELAEFEQALGLFGQALGAVMTERSTPEEAMSWAQQQSTFQ